MSIESGVPIEERPRIAPKQRFPELAKMDVGDSFLIPDKEFRAGDFLLVTMYDIKHHQRHESKQYENGDVRFWRVA